MTADTCALTLLPGVPEELVRRCFDRRSADKIANGQSFSLDYSSELIANAFGWFLERPHLLPSLPGLEYHYLGTENVDLNTCVPFPWLGGRHPTLGAVIDANTHLIGIVSKRDEPFRGYKKPQFSAAFYRHEWDIQMRPYLDLRDQLLSGSLKYRFLDAAQLVKQALALSIQSAQTCKQPILYYIYHEPVELDGQFVPIETRRSHIEELSDFRARIEEARVEFFFAGYFDWLSEWIYGDAAVERHGENVMRYLAYTGLVTSKGWGCGIHETIR